METLDNRAALVVLSGGQDSTTCLAWAKKYFRSVHAVSFHYGQHHIRELEAAANVARLAGVDSYEVVHLGRGILKGTSPLTNEGADLEQYEDYASMDKIIGDRVEKTFVPMRNALFLTLAANRAVCLGVGNLVTGVCQADNANYPDCRLSFVAAQNKAICEALGTDTFNILAPLMDLSKDASIHLMRQLDCMAIDDAGTKARLGCLPWLAFTHTAYDGQYPPVGKDHASVLRAHGFEKAGIPDPLVVRAWMEGLMALPDTANYTHGIGSADFTLLCDAINAHKKALGIDGHKNWED